MPGLSCDYVLRKNEYEFPDGTRHRVVEKVLKLNKYCLAKPWAEYHRLVCLFGISKLPLFWKFEWWTVNFSDAIESVENYRTRCMQQESYKKVWGKSWREALNPEKNKH